MRRSANKMGAAMQGRMRRQLTTLAAILLCVAAAAKIYKAAYRGETMQSRVKPLN